jgi:hypothetical protein
MEIVPPKRTGKKATAIMTVEVLVEIEESESYYDMEQQAHDKLRKHVVDGRGFLPFGARVKMIEEFPLDTIVQKTTINPRRSW